MSPHKIHFKSYCWSLGTTSYRTKNFNFNIEYQLSLLNAFWNLPQNANAIWNSNKTLQAEYYEFMKEKNFLTGEADIKDKDAREKTSGLCNLGLIDENRKLTDAGRVLLKISENGDFSSNNPLKISKDSFIYLKQLLKTSIVVEKQIVRPFIVLLFLIWKLNFLTYDEYKYLLPLCINKEITDNMPNQIMQIRKGKKSIDAVIIDTLMSMQNYKQALKLFTENVVDENLICEIALNRKSRKYDKDYFPLYSSLKKVVVEKDNSYIKAVYESLQKIKISKYWRKLLFNTQSQKAILNNLTKHFVSEKFKEITDENSFKLLFFKYLHLFKAKATLSDYFDLNRRYIKTTDVVIFEDSQVKLDIVPKYFFSNATNDLYSLAFMKSTDLYSDVTLQQIHPSLKFDKEKIIFGINADFGASISTFEEIYSIVEDKRYSRLQNLIDNIFTDDNLILLLEYFEIRKDSEITNLVTDNADVPTIFEYVLGIIWYKCSNRQGKILDFMKLSLDANLLPKSHAAGGEADIVYKYSSTDKYAEHYLLLEATLANANNQRSMEMEPVSRHLGQHLLKTLNLNSYCVFVTTYLDINVIADFRSRKTTPFYNRKDYSKYVEGMKIIPLQTSELKLIIRNKLNYKDLYLIFENAHKALEMPAQWYNQNIANILLESGKMFTT